LVLLLPVQHAQERPAAVLSVSPQSWLTEGDSVTLNCEITDCSTNWTFSWYRELIYRDSYWDMKDKVELLSDSSRGSRGSYTISPVTRNHTGVYMCSAERDGRQVQTDRSLPQALWITGESPPVSLIISPNRTQHFTRDSLTLSCEDQSHSTGWTVRRYTHSRGVTDCSGWGSVRGSKCKIRSLSTSYTGVYWCVSESGEHSKPVNITVHETPRPVLSVSPQSWLTEGDSVTLNCEVTDSPTGWTFSWYRDVIHKVELLSDSSRGSRGSYTISPVTRNHTGVYRCSAERDGQKVRTDRSLPQPLWITGESPPVSLIVNPGRTQHFTDDSLSLSCEDQSNSTGWTVKHYTHSERRVTDCSQWGSVTGSTCDISSLYTSHTGVYWCESESGGNSNPVNITVHERPRPVLSVSPQSWLSEGDSVTLNCEAPYASTDWTFSWYREVIYRYSDGDIRHKVELLSDSSRGSCSFYTISPVTRNHTGVYMCSAERDGRQVQTDRSLPQPLWITGESPPVSLINNPSRTQHFTDDSLSLICEDQSKSTGWTVKHYTHSERRVTDCSQWGSVTGPTCEIRSLRQSHIGVYWCVSESGENGNPINITVHGVVLSVSPQSWLTEGDSVTLRCEVTDASKNWTFSWYRHVTYRDSDGDIMYEVEPLSDSSRGCGGSYTISPAARKHTGVYMCSAERDGQQVETDRSDLQPLWITGESSPVSLIINPSRTHHFTGDSLTLTCVDQSHSTGWTVKLYTHEVGLATCSLWGSVTGSSCNINSLSTSHTGVYWCESESGENSNPVNITVHERPRPVLSASPQSWLTEGVSVTLSCEVTDSPTNWTFSWYRAVIYRDSDGDIRHKVELLSHSSRGSRGSYTISPVTHNHTGVYMCSAERDGQQVQTDRSLPQPLWITGESPPVSLIINPSRTQHFTGDSLSLSCGDQSHSTGWTVRRYTHRWGLTACSWCSSVTGRTCKISSLSTSYTGVYWCESESGANSNPVNITVHDGDVILESPVHPVTEGRPLTLRCLDRSTKSSNLRADFYKDGSVLQTQTTGEMIIHKVSKSDEGFYHCKHPERGESPKSWVSVR
ncbi:Fc receptor-like protein 5 isoform X1, partial [Clarias magur]